MCSLVFARAHSLNSNSTPDQVVLCVRAARGERAKEKPTNKLKSVMIQTKRPRNEQKSKIENKIGLSSMRSQRGSANESKKSKTNTNNRFAIRTGESEEHWTSQAYTCT